jgi:hypothetical protein
MNLFCLIILVIKVNKSLFGGIVLVLISAFLISKLSKNSGSGKYNLKPKNQWNMLSEGTDPTDEHQSN